MNVDLNSVADPSVVLPAQSATPALPSTNKAVSPAAAAPVGQIGAQAASLAELRAALPQADADFLLAQLEAGATVAQAQANHAYMAKLTAKHQAAQAAMPAKPSKPGVTATVPAGQADESQEDETDPVQAFNAAVEQLTAKGMERSVAVDTVRKRNPDLAHSYLLAINADKPGAQRQLRETRRS
jgi:hypothetical protein